MAPLTHSLGSELQEEREDGTATFQGHMDQEWCIGSVPNGGYSLSCLCTAVQKFMRLQKHFGPDDPKGHYDPMHISASYFVATTATIPFTVECKMLKKGRGFSTVEAKLVQDSVTRIHAHVIMCSFAVRNADKTLVPTIDPSQPFYARCPMKEPKDCVESRRYQNEKMGMRKRIRLFDDPELSKDAIEKRGRLEWGGWIEIINEGSPKKDVNTIPLYADMSENTATLMPNAPRNVWLPTMFLAIEFKRAVDLNRPLLRAGMFSTGRFISQGQHESDVEVWSHPDDAHLLDLPPGSGPQILCIARQLALVMDLSINKSQNKQKKSAKL